MPSRGSFEIHDFFLIAIGLPCRAPLGLTLPVTSPPLSLDERLSSTCGPATAASSRATRPRRRRSSDTPEKRCDAKSPPSRGVPSFCSFCFIRAGNGQRQLSPPSSIDTFRGGGFRGERRVTGRRRRRRRQPSARGAAQVEARLYSSSAPHPAASTPVRWSSGVPVGVPFPHHQHTLATSARGSSGERFSSPDEHPSLRLPSRARKPRIIEPCTRTGRTPV